MTSDRKIKANRANARASTGPKTTRGRARAARNALRHGLSLAVCSDPALCAQVEALAHDIAGTDANADLQELARRVAEAQIDLCRVRHARHRLLAREMSDPYYDSRANVREKFRLICSLLRPSAPETSMAAFTRVLTSTPQGPEKFATILAQEAKQLLAMDRYERRALSRRRNAIEAFDAMRGATQDKKL